MLVTFFPPSTFRHPFISVKKLSWGTVSFGQHHHILDECVTSLLLLVIFCRSTQMIIFILSNALTNGAQPSLLFLALILVKTGLTQLPTTSKHCFVSNKQHLPSATNAQGTVQLSMDLRRKDYARKYAHIIRLCCRWRHYYCGMLCKTVCPVEEGMGCSPNVNNKQVLDWIYLSPKLSQFLA